MVPGASSSHKLPGTEQNGEWQVMAQVVPALWETSQSKPELAG